MSSAGHGRMAQGRWLEPAGYRLAGLLLGVAVLQLGGCVQKTSQSTQYLDQDNLGPRVLAADENAAAAAYNESENRLSEVRWGVIERKGPKTVWEQFSFNRRKKSDELPGTGVEEPSAEPIEYSLHYPTTAPTSQPTTQPIDYPIYPEAGLPLKVIELPDGRIRLIWTLRSYGGPEVSSARDAVTARRTVTLKAAELTPLVTVLQQQVGTGGTVVPLPRENIIVITCDQRLRGCVVETLAKVDTPPRQVEIAARIFEVSQDFDFQAGAQVMAKHIGENNAQSALSVFGTQRALDAAAGGAPFQGSVLNFMRTFEKQGISLEASFQMLADAGLIRLVSAPRMTVAAGQSGYMLAGQELPIQTANLVNSVLTTATQYKPVGVQLYITPQAVGPDRVKLHTISIVSSVSGFAPLPSLTGNNSEKVLINPIIDSREAETAVTVADGDTLVISGLRMTRVTTREQKVPGLGDLPLLGWLFKNHRSQRHMTDLYFFVTPTLL